MVDAVLLISFGGPQGPDDIRPFLANVLRGRRVPPARVDEVAHHYELFGGVSPITGITLRQAAGLRERLAAAGHPLPVYVGMRNWYPFLADACREPEVVLRATAATECSTSIRIVAVRARAGIICSSWPPMHPAGLRCSSLTYSRYARSSRLAGRAPRRPR